MINLHCECGGAAFRNTSRASLSISSRLKELEYVLEAGISVPGLLLGDHVREQLGREREAKQFGRACTQDDYFAKTVFFGKTPVAQLLGGKRARGPAQSELCFAHGANLTSGERGTPCPKHSGARVPQREARLEISPEPPEAGNVLPGAVAKVMS